MDIDESSHTRNSPFIHYFDLADSFPWREPRPEQIRLRRANMDDTLIFDILLTSGGVVDSYVLYPPETPEGLQLLLDAIDSSTYDSLKKDCLIYFLLKWHQDGRERVFQEKRCIPPQFVALADAYWHLDTGINISKAVSLLSDARLNRDYASKIIRAISLSPESAPLIRRYVQTAKPLLVEPPDIDYYALALAENSILNAWEFSRSFSEADSTRTRILQKIFEWIIFPQPRTIALKQLISLPLSSFEENILNQFTQKPPNSIPFSSIAILQDLICVRLIQGGRYTEAIKLDRQFSSTTPQKHLKDTHERSNMVQDVYKALPEVEKALLDLELDPVALQQQLQPISTKPTSPELARKAGGPPAEDQTLASLSQSWEEVHVPETLVSKSTPLRHVQVPGAAGGSTPAASLPFFPTKSLANGTPKRNSPMVPSMSSSTRPPVASLLSGVGSRMAFGTPNAIASPASGMKFPPFTPAAHLASSQGSNLFRSASRQPNAFYTPPVRSNGVKRAFEDESRKSPVRDEGKSSDEESHLAEVGKQPELNKTIDDEGTRREPAEEDDTALQYSVFGNETSQSNVEQSKKPRRQSGRHRLDEEDDNVEPVKTRRGKTTRVAQKSAATVSAISKPPAKKVKQSKNVVRHIPGGLMDEDEDEEEEEDQVSNLPSSRNPRPSGRAIRKTKSSSVDTTDEMEGGVQTRRRSSRLTAASSTGSVRAPSPEVIQKTRRAGRPSAASKKRR